MTISKENVSKRYSILFSGFGDSHDIHKWVGTQRSLGTAGLKSYFKIKYDMMRTKVSVKFTIGTNHQTTSLYFTL